MLHNWRSAVALAVLVLVTVAGARDFVMPKAFHAKTYPARDAHDQEQFTIAADPYDMPDKVAGVFNVDYIKEGLLPIQLIFSNDADTPVALAKMSVTFITRGNVKLLPDEAEDIYRRIGKQPARAGQPTGGVKLPIPLPRKKGSFTADVKDEVEAISAHPRAVEPKSTQTAIYVFDVEGLEHPLAGGRLVINGITRSGQELFYFEIPMEKYLTYQPEKPPQQ